MATCAPKEKRRNSEKRKEKSRDAARCRRSKESEIFADLAELLPIPASLSGQLDKASVMRLTIAYLKARALLDNNVSGADGSISPPLAAALDENDALDSFLLKALDGVLLALSSEGDIIYATDNVSQQLGLAQYDMIGQSIYDYSHPCDHDEIREMLAVRPDGNDERSFFLRLKSTLTSKGRSVNFKSPAYRVMNCTGRIIQVAADGSVTGSDLSADGSAEDVPTHYLVMIGDPIPHPSNIETPIDGFTFLTKHTLDMKYTYVDEKITDFLGYVAEDLEGKSAYEFHHILDNDLVLKSYKTLLTKGQIQTPCYRFMARHGGYAWIQTQASLIYGSRDSRPQAIVCVHACLSEIQEKELILSTSQCVNSSPKSSSRVCAEAQRPVESIPAARRERRPAVPKPVAAKPVTVKPTVVKPELMSQNITSKLFVPKTAEMNSLFLDFDEVKGIEILKEEPDDLTHLAPIAGDSCIPLDIPLALGDLFDSSDLSPEMLECFPLTGFEFPLTELPDEDITDADSPAVRSTSSTFKDSPYLFLQTNPGASMQLRDFDGYQSVSNSSSPCSNKENGCGSGSEDEMNQIRSPDDLALIESAGNMFINSRLDDMDTSPLAYTVQPKSTALQFDEEEEEMEHRAPFIPMGDLPIFDPTDLLIEMDLDNFSMVSPDNQPKDKGIPAQTALIKLLQASNPEIPRHNEDPKEQVSAPFSVTARSLQHSGGLKRSPSPPPDDLIHKRQRSSVTTTPSLLPPDPSHSNRVNCSWLNDLSTGVGSKPSEAKPPQLIRNVPTPVQESRTPTLMELLTARPPKPQSASVLQNLLVSGHDLQTGHKVLKQNGGLKKSDESGLKSLPSSTSLPCPPRSLSSSTSAKNDTKPVDDGLTFSLSSFGLDPDPIDSSLIESGDFFITLELPMEFGTVE